MKKILCTTLALLLCLTTAGCGASSKKDVKLDTAEDMISFVEEIYATSGFELNALENREIDLTDGYSLIGFTGLSDESLVETVVVSESMIGINPYSLVLVKVKDASKVESIKEEMVNNIDMRKWVCVNAEMLYASNHNDVIFLVMGSTEDAKAQYDAFKKLVDSNIGKELTKEFELADF